jgi:hypothetical protein
MAINNGSLYLGNATNTIALIEKLWQPIPYFGKHKISTNNVTNFKVTNESTFFGAYSANATVKAKAYNDLRFQFNNLGEQIRANLAVQLLSFSTSDPQFATFTNIQIQTAVANLSLARLNSNKLNAYSFNNSVKLYMNCNFNDVNLVAQLQYPKIAMEISYV